MKLLIIRHGKAEDHFSFAQKTGQSDDFRPLTDEGKKEMQQVAKELKKIAPQIDLLLTSPLTRAVQTAEIVVKAYGLKALVEVEELRPEMHPKEIFSRIKKVKKANQEVVAVTGHEPHLSTLATWALTGKAASVIDLKKGGVCLIDFPEDFAGGKGALLWIFGPKQLRKLRS